MPHSRNQSLNHEHATVRIAALLGASVLAFSPVQLLAQKPVANLSSDPRYTQALRALDEGIPQVSIQKLTECLSARLSADDRTLATLQLARALLAAGRSEDALKNLRSLTSQSTAVNFLRARALAALGRWEEACPIYHQLAMQPGAPVSYKIAEAECLHSMGRLPEAIQTLEPIATAESAEMATRLRLADFCIENGQTDKCEEILKSIQPASAVESKAKRYIEGRIFLAKRQYEQGLGVFQEILKTPEGLSENLLIGATLGITDVRLALNGPEAADNVIEDFISQHPNVRGIDVLFRRLDQIYSAEKTPSDAELQKWSEATPATRSSMLAAYYFARACAREQKFDKALAALDQFITSNPSHPLLAEAYLLQGNVLDEQRKPVEALRAFESAIGCASDRELLAEAQMAAATLHFKQHEYQVAQGLFQKAAQQSQRLWQKAIFNSALSWLNQTNYDRFLADYVELSKRYPESELRSELVLEEGLFQARLGDPRAEKTLQRFTRDFPKHPRVAEARLALAEIVFLAPDQNIDAANRYLKAANETPQAGDTRERGDYLAIFLADSAENRDDAKVIEACRQFVDNYPSSPLLADVLMKLGQVYFRRSDFPNAGTQFETLARQMPASPFAEAALFMAGQAALQMMNTDRALELFDQVAKLNGPLKLYARQQQAILKTRMGPEQDAIKLYDVILDGKPDAELRFAAFCGKGDNYLLMGARDPKYFDQAIAAYNELAAQPDTTTYWRNQALYKKGKCFEKQNKPNEALAAFYDVIQSQANRNTGPDYLWFYKAGFDAASILESQEQWKPAIAIYQKMVGLEGPRSEEAKARLTQLRLEHFIWDE